MTMALLQAAGLAGLGGAAAAAMPVSGRAMACVLGSLGIAAAALPLVVAPALPPGGACLAALALAAALIGQLRLFSDRAAALAGGWRGRLIVAAGPVVCAITLLGATGPALPRGAGWLTLAAVAASVLAVAGLAMVTDRVAGLGRLADPAHRGSPQAGRVAGLRLAMCAALGLALDGLGVVAWLATAERGARPDGLAAVLLTIGLLVPFGGLPLQGLALSWLRAAPPWLAGGLTVGTVGPAVLVWIGAPATAATSWILDASGIAGVAVSGWLAATGRAALRDAVWLALSGLILAAFGSGQGGAGTGAVLLLLVQVLVACLPAGLGRWERLAMLVGCFLPAVTVLAGLGGAGRVIGLAGLSGLLVAGLGGDGAVGRPAHAGDPWRWMVLVLLAGAGGLLPAPLLRLAAAVAAGSAP